MLLLTGMVKELGQAEVARRLDISAAAISQLLSGKYQASPDNILEKVREIFGGETVACPELRTDIPYGECAAHRRREPTTDSHYARMYRACKKCGGKQ
jgi:DNA-binding transcriptional regulator YdaS (Cro superfamily)